MPADNLSIPPVNPGEPHLPVVVLADTSLSLELTGAIDKLNQGIQEFCTALRSDPLASLPSGTIQLSVIAALPCRAARSSVSRLHEC